ncbi:type II toxin-antitoxin system prevent-host-death family antitoxin [Sphingobium sp. AN641]|uniref:type II toxin-antitoxin system prevent-host-death family antitoxin n=1 Tax=Sphingobium sp. AN641 TaxID=3133443 RepID=UPI0030BFDBFF
MAFFVEPARSPPDTALSRVELASVQSGRHRGLILLWKLTADCPVWHNGQNGHFGNLGMKITSTEFKNGIGRFQDIAMRQPVEITKNGRTHTVLISADYYELLTHGRIVRRIEDMDAETLSAIAAAEVPAAYAHLDALLVPDASN